MSYKGPSVNFIRKYINSEDFAGLSLDDVMKRIALLWEQKQSRKKEKSLCNQAYTNQQTCLQNPACMWTKTSPKKGYCKNSSDADIITLLHKQNKLNQTSTPQEVRMAVLLYKKGLLGKCK